MGIGEKIKRLRIKNGLTQEELAMRSELSKGFISQVERDLTSPSISTLVDILECLGTNLKDFFNEKTQEKIVFNTEDFYVATDKELHSEKKWVVPTYQKNLLEPILVSFEVNGQTEEEDPHGGEEFGFVLSGTVYVHIGDKKYKAKKGESFYFRPVMSHYLSNAGKQKASVLWVSTRYR
ncbi:MAG: helix-turn-helix domain-containing protein [Bacillota bacterium]|jgi:transcriptional regulator with XRE-family HTH domain|nr:cupin domain-containing protein [Clostridia bacterium]